MKKIIVFLLFLILVNQFIPVKFLKSQTLKDIEFLFIKDKEEKLVNIEKNKFKNFSYNFSKKNENFYLNIKGRGDLIFKIFFKNMEKIFPKENGIFITPFYVLKNKDNKYFMFSIDSHDLHYFETKNRDDGFEIIYNFYVEKNESIKFKIKEVNSIFDAIETYYKFYGIKERRVDLDGLILPNISLTTIVNNVGIENLSVKGRIIDPKEEYAPDRVLEGAKFKLKNFILFDPIKLKFENIELNEIEKRLYFDENPYNKLIGIQILTSSIKNKDKSLIKIEKKSEATFKIVSGEKIPDYKENSIDTIIFLNPEVSFLKNKGISSFDIYYSRYIYPLNISITILNRQLEIKGENEAKYYGLALDFSHISDFFNFDKKHFNKNPKSFISGEIAQFYAANLYNFLNSLQKETNILSINPKYFQLIMNSDVIYKEIEDLRSLDSLPIERVLVPNRPIFFSFRLKNEEINEETLDKIFKYSLIYGIYPTFSKHKDEPFSIWDDVSKLKILTKYKDFYTLINKVEVKGFLGNSVATIENGEIYQFGNLPDFYLTFDGYGKIKIDKNVFESIEDISIINPINNEKVKFYEENGKIVIDSNGLYILNIKGKNEAIQKENKTISTSSKFERKNISYLIILVILFLILLNFSFRKIKFDFKLKPVFVISILFIILLILNYFLGISSPFFIYLSFGIYFLFASIFSSMNKKDFLLNFSLVFLFSSLFYYLLNGSQIIFSPPYYIFYNTYFISIMLTLFIFIFHHFEWKKIYDIIIFLTILTIVLISNPTRNPFYLPQIDYTFLTINLLFTFIILLLSKSFIKTILFIILVFLNVIYIFNEKIYFILLSKGLFISVDFIPNLILLFILSILIIYFSKSTFKIKVKIAYNFLIIFFIFISLYLNRVLYTSPHIFGIVSSIIKLIFYIILIIYVIFFVERALIKKEE